MDDVLLTETAGAVRTITLNRAGARNALSGELIGRLAEALLAAEEEPGVAAVVLTGVDPAFCAGLDLREVGARGRAPGGGHRPQDFTLVDPGGHGDAGGGGGQRPGGDRRPGAGAPVQLPTLGEGVELERQRFAGWKLAPADVEARRQAVIDRGRSG